MLVPWSTQIKPALSQFRICGPRNSILVDITSGSVIPNKKGNYKSYLTFFVPPLLNAREHLRNARRNIGNFATRKLYQDYGMTELIRRFYQSIEPKGPPPIPHRELLLTTRIMDEIFAHIYPDTGQVPVGRGSSEAQNRQSSITRGLTVQPCKESEQTV
jgi:hypothetical protein